MVRRRAEKISSLRHLTRMGGISPWSTIHGSSGSSHEPAGCPQVALRRCRGPATIALSSAYGENEPLCIHSTERS